jgi:hypothetical protein
MEIFVGVSSWEFWTGADGGRWFISPEDLEIFFEHGNL